MRTRRELLRAVGQEATATKEALEAALMDKGQLSIMNAGLGEGLERQTLRNEELRTAASALEAQLSAATAEVAQQRGQLAAVGTETMNMRQVRNRLIAELVGFGFQKRNHRFLPPVKAPLTPLKIEYKRRCGIYLIDYYSSLPPCNNIPNIILMCIDIYVIYIIMW